jgi:hypothetical protein
MRLLIAGIIVALLVAGFIVVMALKQPKIDFLGLGTFVVLTLTLVALSLYTHDTHSMAKVEQEQWKRNSVLNATYSMEVRGEAGGPGRTMFCIHNPSTLVVQARVRCNFRVDGELVEYHDDFNGRNAWSVFPQQMSQGWFEIAPLLAKRGKTCPQMVAEVTEGNRHEQFTMDLEIEFRGELGDERKLPARKHFFDFKEWRWVPYFTKQDDWV